MEEIKSEFPAKKTEEIINIPENESSADYSNTIISNNETKRINLSTLKESEEYSSYIVGSKDRDDIDIGAALLEEELKGSIKPTDSYTVNTEDSSSLSDMKKGELIDMYKENCNGKGITAMKDWQLQKKTKKDIIGIINSLQNNTFNESDNNTKSARLYPKVNTASKKHAARFLYDTCCMGSGVLETYMRANPEIGIDLSGLSNEMSSTKAEQLKDMEAIVNRYPGIVGFLNPILTYAAKYTSVCYQRHNLNIELNKGKKNDDRQRSVSNALRRRPDEYPPLDKTRLPNSLLHKKPSFNMDVPSIVPGSSTRGLSKNFGKL